MNKQCPLLSAGRLATEDCIKEECAWWDKDRKKCAILSLATSKIKVELAR